METKDNNSENNSYLNILKENNVKKQFESNLFIPKDGEIYYHIDDWWNLHNNYKNAIGKFERGEYEDEPEDLPFVINRCFRTREEAAEHYEFLIAEAELKIAIMNINKGWTPDWEKTNQKKYSIYYFFGSKKLLIDCSYSVQRTSKESSLMYFKDYDSAKYIVENYKKQLLIYFGVKDE